MEKKCYNCGYVHKMSLSTEKKEYYSKYGTFCSQCGAISDTLHETALMKENRIKRDFIKKECLKRIFKEK